MLKKGREVSLPFFVDINYEKIYAENSFIL